MALNNQQPIPWVPAGVSDSVDGSNVFSGAMSSLKDLVPDPSTRGLYVPRPASTEVSDFSTSNIGGPGFVSASLVVGDLVYGMIATTDFADKDVPFIYDLAAGAFIDVTGATVGNTPDSPATTGDWVPPIIAVVGTKVIVTHQGFSSGAPIGVIDISTPSAPTWTSTNTSPTPLSAVPTAVHSFNGRAWYAIDNILFFSDNLLPTTITNADQSVTIGDDSIVKGMGSVPLSSVTAGSVAAMMAFKAKTIFQITGDIALNTLLVGEVAAGIGTDSPLSITPTPSGLMFISQHGLRSISLGGEVSPIIGGDGSGVSIPFINSRFPSRIAGAFNVNTYRVTTQNEFIPTLPTQDWWYNTDLANWSGPHSFPAGLVQPWRGSFIIIPTAVDGSLWQSDIVPLATSGYIENGNQMTFGYATVPMPNAPTMNLSNITESSIGLQFSQVGGTVNFTALDENGGVLDSTSKTIIVDAAVWDVSDWGTGNWGGNVTNYQQVQIPWTKPLVFNQASFAINGNAVTGFKIGVLNLRYQHLGDMVN